MKLMDDFNKSLQGLYDHVGFTEDWTVYAVEDKVGMFWKIIPEKESIFSGNTVDCVRYADTMNQFNSDGDYWEDEIYMQRHYDKWIYRGTELTMIIVDTHCDGNKFFAFFSNNKEII